MINSIANDNKIDFDTDTDCNLIQKCVIDYYGFYFNGGKGPNYKQPDNKDPCYQIAYLYKYSPLRADLVCYIFNKEEKIKNIIVNDIDGNGRTNICALGAGPGTELVGVGKWAAENGIKGEIDFVLSDCEKEWSECIKYAKKYSFSSMCKAEILDFLNSCEPLSRDSFEEKELKDCKIFIISYLISEIMDDVPSKNKFKCFLQSLSDFSNPETIFLVIDRKQDSVERSARDILETCDICFSGLSYPSDRSSYNSYGPGFKNFQIDRFEDRINLGRLYEKLTKLTPPHYPEGRGDVLWILGQKR